MTNWRSFQHSVETFLQARRGLPTPRAAGDSVMFFVMFVAAVGGMVLGLVWLPSAASTTRIWWQAVGGAVAAAIVVYGVLAIFKWWLGFRVIAALADFALGSLAGIVVWGILAAIHRDQLNEWWTLIVLGGGLIGCILGAIVGRGIDDVSGT